MPWSAGPALFSERQSFLVSFNTGSGKQTDLNLWDYLGQPGAQVDAVFNFDGLAVCTMVVGNFTAGSVITINLTGAAQVFGRGGKGGDASQSFFEGLLGTCLAFPSFFVGDGQPAILMPGTGITLNLDADDGFVWGGGGGGGGGGYRFSGGICQSGGGGGGAQGWEATVGGVSVVTNGAAGGPAGPGAGGAGDNGADGGDGGVWGQAGDAGIAGTDGGNDPGGLGGRAVQNVSDTVNLSGAKNQATLISESRLLGRNGDPIGA